MDCLFKRLRATAGQGPNYVGPSCGYVGHVGLMLTHVEPKDPKNGNSKKKTLCKTQDILMVGNLSWGYVGPSWGYIGPSWGLCWPTLGLYWPILGAMLAQLGAMLAQLGAMLAHLGAMLAHLGAMLAHLWGLCCPILGLCSPILRPMLAQLDPS